LPAFYSEWFINRIREGYFISVNPFNPGQRRRVSLRPEDVAAIFFWSKNPAPLLKYLSLLDRQGYRYLFHYTLNNYPRCLEPRIPLLTDRVAIFKKLAERIGPARVIWRYDPIIISNLTSIQYHLDKFGYLAEELRGYVNEIRISFLQFYDKVRRKLTGLLPADKLVITDLREVQRRDDLKRLALNFAAIARANKMEIKSCAEKIDLSSYGIHPGGCIDLELVNRIFGLALPIKKDKAQRPECLCAQSVDMGSYDSCKFNCSYCYANQSDQAVFKNCGFYDPEGDRLIDKDLAAPD